jgi:phosphotransferase system HPr-like phosphotransfer protein
MQEINIKLTDMLSIREFVKEVVVLDYDVDLVQGRYIVDAKSIMGIFALDITSPIKVVANTNDASSFFAAIDKYVVK